MTLLPFRAAQVVLASLAALVLTRSVPAAPLADELDFTLSLVGERERADGSWEPVDLLRDHLPVDRFQVVLTPTSKVRARLEAITDDVPERVFPTALVRPPLLAAWQSTAFPSPQTFFEVSGEAKLRLVVSPESQGDREQPAGPATADAVVATRTFRLTDGSPARITERRFHGGGTVSVEFALEGR